MHRGGGSQDSVLFSQDSDLKVSSGEAEDRFDWLPSEVGGAASATSPRSVLPKILFCSKGDAERITQGEKTNGKLYQNLTLRIYIPRPVATV